MLFGAAERDEAERALEREHAARVSAESRVTAAERRLERATTVAQRAAERLGRAKAKRNARRNAPRTLQQAHDVAQSTKDVVAPSLERAVARVADRIDHLSS